MSTCIYKGFNIMARPYLLYGSNRWAVDLEISRHDRTQTFGVDGRYGTEQEADARCSGLGRRIIDGEIPGWSVDRMRAAAGDRLAFIRLSKGRAVRPLIIAGILVAALGAFLLLRGVSLESRRDMDRMGGLSVAANQWPTIAVDRWPELAGGCGADRARRAEACLRNPHTVDRRSASP